MSYEVFNSYAIEYDAWYDTEVGKAIFDMEVDCLKPIFQRFSKPYLEVGVGTGRFAQALGIEYGIDPAPVMVQMAKSRGVKTLEGTGEELPFPDEMFGAVLVAFTLCFLDDPQKVLQEARRVLDLDGGLVLGMIPRDSTWGEYYANKCKEGHAIYSKARFFSMEEVEDLLRQSGFKVREYCSTLFQPPGQRNYQYESPVFSYQQSGGSVAILSAKTAT